MEAIGIYIHIPFCNSKCSYCDFSSFVADEDLKKSYVEALILEISSKKDLRPVDSIYMGGGTPSCLEISQLKRIFRAVFDNYNVLENCEVSMEANPGTISEELICEIKNAGVNRLSMGAQASDKRLLDMLGRRHSFFDVIEGVHTAKNCGIDNINIDLMLGLPMQDNSILSETIKEALKLPLKHISCYGLIVEEGTRLEKRISSGELSLPEVEEERKMYYETRETLKNNKFFQYEISNFALRGFECRHNVSCWKRKCYLGFGLSSHGLIERSIRQENTSDMREYLKGSPPKISRLSEEEIEFEAIMLGLRLTEGIDIAGFERNFGIKLTKKYQKQIEKWQKLGGLCVDCGNIYLSEKGMDLMNSILLDFM